REFPRQPIGALFGQQNRERRSVIKHQHELLPCPVQRLEDFHVATHVSRDRASRGIPIFHDPVTDMRECDGITSKQRAVAVTMSCHALDPSFGAYGAHPHRTRTMQRLFRHSVRSRSSRPGENQCFDGRAQTSHEDTRGSDLARRMRVTTYERSPATISCPRRYVIASLRPFTVMKRCSPRREATQRLITPMVCPPVRGSEVNTGNLSSFRTVCVTCRFVNQRCVRPYHPVTARRNSSSRAG